MFGVITYKMTLLSEVSVKSFAVAAAAVVVGDGGLRALLSMTRCFLKNLLPFVFPYVLQKSKW